MAKRYRQPTVKSQRAIAVRRLDAALKRVKSVAPLFDEIDNCLMGSADYLYDKVLLLVQEFGEEMDDAVAEGEGT